MPGAVLWQHGVDVLSQCNESLVAVFAGMKKPELFHFSKTFIAVVVISAVCNSFTGSFGYLTFGSCVKADVLLSYIPTHDVIVCVILIAVNTCTTYPILLYVGRYCHHLPSVIIL